MKKSSSFIDFCLRHEASLLTSPTNNKNADSFLGDPQIMINNNSALVNLPKLSTTGLNVIVFSDGSTAYLPYFISSFSRKVSGVGSSNNTSPLVKFVLSRSDLFYFLQSRS